jgi:hypothetical protein
MFLPIDKYPFLQKLKANTDVIAAEFASQQSAPFMENFLAPKISDLDSHTSYWVKEGGFDSSQIGYDARDGSWASFALYKKGFPIKICDVASCFPVTHRLLLEIPNLNFASFFKLAPSSGTKDHSHSESNLIFHLCLTDLDGKSVLHCGNEEIVMSKKGDYCLFDYSIHHSSFNSSSRNRINLVVDFSI